ncbi:MAG TPA: hypothetical protein VL360_06095 [Gammaproteobacteria bacterium]|jgi:hypothetical protein|nr:hypothetical protein [Gammaproteobacteria bacterium]
MTNQEFKIWLSGYFDLENGKTVLSAKQLWIIHNHLQLVLTVSGELDEKNKWLKTRLEGLHKIAATPFLSAEFTQVTQQIQKWLSSK